MRTLAGKAFSSFYLSFVYNLPTKSLAYNLAEETCRLFLHGFRVMRVKILRNGRILVTEAGGYVDGLCARLDELGGVRVAEAVGIKLLAVQPRPYRAYGQRPSVGDDADHKAANQAVCRRQLLRQYDDGAVMGGILVDELIGFAQAQFVFGLRRFQGTQVGEERGIYVERPYAVRRFWRIEIVADALPDDRNRAVFEVYVIPCEAENLAHAHSRVVEEFQNGTVSLMLEEGGSLFRGDHRALDDLLRCAPWDGKPCTGIGTNQLGGVDRIFQRDGQYRFRLLNRPVRQAFFRQGF